MIIINTKYSIADKEVELSPIRAQGAGGQNVNKVSSAIHLRFNIEASSLPSEVKARLLTSNDKRITQQGVLVIKAQQYRTQEANKQDALLRLVQTIEPLLKAPQRRIATRPSYSAKQRRIEHKTRRGKTKVLRGKVRD